MKKSKFNIDINLNMILMITLIIFVCYVILNYKFYIVATGSMQPSLNINEFIIVKKSSIEENYEIGEIITFNDKELKEPVTHRIVAIDNDNSIHTKGDANNIEDKEIVQKSEIIGKVIFSSLIIGAMIVNYKWHIIILFCLFIFFINLFNFFKEKEENNENKK